MFRRFASLLVLGFTILVGPYCLANDGIALNEQEYFAGPGFSFLLFHNNYQVGYQGGLQMILNDERVLDSGDLFVVPKHGQRGLQLQVLRREVDRAQGLATIFGRIQGWDSGYQLQVKSDGQSIFITLKLDRPLDWSKVERAGFKISLYPGTYYTKSYQGDADSGVFPEQYLGKGLLYGPAKMVNVAQEDLLHNFTISRQDGSLTLVDTREGSPQGWFTFEAPFAAGSQATEIGVTITPKLSPAWRRTPVIGVSQVGYLPRQPKRAILEMDPRDAASDPVNLYQLQPSGEEKLVKSEVPKAWGKFLRYQYLTFDFSEVQEPGLYVLEFRGQKGRPDPDCGEGCR